MNCFLFLLTAFFSNTPTAKLSIFENSTLEAFICSRCKNATQEAIATDIRARLKTLDGYFNNIEDIGDMFCSDTRYKIVPMMKQITIDMKPCFNNPNETYLPNFIYEGFAEFIELLCANRTIEIFFSDQGNDCKTAMEQYEGGIEFKNCSCELFNMFKAETLTYDDMCFELKSAENCYREALDHACPHFAAFKVLNSQFFHAVGNLCNGAKIYSSEVLLISFFGILINSI